MKFEDLKVGMKVILRHDWYNLKNNLPLEGKICHGTIYSIKNNEFSILWENNNSASYGFTKDMFYYLDFKTPEYHKDFEELINGI